MIERETGGIILAAGQGKRMESTTRNKVTLPLSGKPMIQHTVELLRTIETSPIVIVVGFAQESVRELFQDEDIIFAEQTERLGTAHAVQTAIKELPEKIEDVIILQGDDSAFYKPETVEGLIKQHKNLNSSFTFLTIDVDNPTGLGRILRNENGELEGIIEEKDATTAQKEIAEINPACYVASVEFLKKYLKEIKPSPVTGEYYLTSLIDIGLSNNEKVQAFRAGKIPWRGVNTAAELQEAEVLYDKNSRTQTAS